MQETLHLLTELHFDHMRHFPQRALSLLPPQGWIHWDGWDHISITTRSRLNRLGVNSAGKQQILSLDKYLLLLLRTGRFCRVMSQCSMWTSWRCDGVSQGLRRDITEQEMTFIVIFFRCLQSRAHGAQTSTLQFNRRMKVCHLKSVSACVTSTRFSVKNKNVPQTEVVVPQNGTNSKSFYSNYRWSCEAKRIWGVCDPKLLTAL